MSYSLDELAQATSLSRRTIYYYMSRGLLPQVGRGRRPRYNESHHWRLLLIRTLADLGIPLDLIQRHLSGLSLERIKLLVAPMLPLDALQAQVSAEVESIRESLRPSAELDILNMGLEDPMALRHRLTALEDQLGRLEGERVKARESVYRNLVSQDSVGSGVHPESMGRLLQTPQAYDAVLARLEEICERLERTVSTQQPRTNDTLQAAPTNFGNLKLASSLLIDGGHDETARLALAELTNRLAETVAQWEAEYVKEVP